ncbi:MAG: RNA 2',3'-cyclic phosphodiesterase [Nanoarchaeota archaeon]|nr:RNA 2',3'-cyclic phosphodiesterase [Nanoarchaeota archaeon]
MQNNEKLRTFICIDFPSEVIKEIARIQSLVNKQNFTGKLIELENLHLTLKFLGEINSKTLDKVKRDLSTIKFNTLNLQLSHVGTFNYKGNPRIVWLKVTGDIFNLQKQIDASLEKLFPKEQRFMSHLTIARVKYAKDKKGFINYISNVKCKNIKFSINNFKLKTSELKPSGPIYNTIAQYPLSI